MMVANELNKVISEIPWKVWAFLIVQGVGVLFWGYRVDTIAQTAKEVNDQQAKRIEMLEGMSHIQSSRETLFDERQKVNTERINYLQRQVDNIVRLLTPHPIGPPKVP